MTRCNMKLIMNEKLLNTFMMLIFPKTCLYETYCVLKCLDLINCYFLVILENNKKIPADFNYNYFYTGIRCILESNHSYLLQRVTVYLFRCWPLSTSTTTSFLRILEIRSITILTVRCLTSFLCIGVKMFETFFIFFWYSEYQNLRPAKILRGATKILNRIISITMKSWILKRL